MLTLLRLVDDLFLAAFAVTITASFTGHIVEFLVILCYIDGCAATGIYNTLLSDLPRNMGLILLFLLLRCGSRFLGLCRSLFLLGLSRLSLSLGCCIENVRNACHLIMLSHILKYNIKLLVFKNLHMIFRSSRIIGQYLSDYLGCGVKVLCYLVYSVFNHAHALFLLLPILLFFSCAALSLLRCFSLISSAAIVCAVSSYRPGDIC